jgi:hypothetical protein
MRRSALPTRPRNTTSVGFDHQTADEVMVESPQGQQIAILTKEIL